MDVEQWRQPEEGAEDDACGQLAGSTLGMQRSEQRLDQLEKGEHD
jgi:hypothetical protein